MAAYVGLSQHINFARLPSPGDRFDLRDLIGEGMFCIFTIDVFSFFFWCKIENAISSLIFILITAIRYLW